MALKFNGKDQTVGISEEEGRQNLIKGLKSDNKAYIYHCYNHYFCPIGFEMTPSKPYHAYQEDLSKIEELETWFIIGEVSKCYPPMHVFKWRDILLDLNQAFPKFLNIRKLDLGIQEKTSQCFKTGSKAGGNLHCIIEFERK